MGTDIHPLIQVQAEGTHGSYWLNVSIDWAPPWMRRLLKEIDHGHDDLEYWRWAQGPGLWSEFSLEDAASASRAVTALTTRNYVMFAILANVRNGYGFAGIQTFDTLPYIQDNRGIPDDIGPSWEWDARTCAKVFGDHSFGWVTLDELEAYDWDITVKTYGVVTGSQYEEFRDAGKRPEQWSRGSGANIEVITPPQYDALPQDVVDAARIATDHGSRTEPRLYVQMAWDAPLRRRVHQWLDTVMPFLRRLRAQEKTTQIRIVFGFDS